jgi:GNAT superfamily N-acetyltransferase
VPSCLRANASAGAAMVACALGDGGAGAGAVATAVDAPGRTTTASPTTGARRQPARLVLRRRMSARSTASTVCFMALGRSGESRLGRLNRVPPTAVVLDAAAIRARAAELGEVMLDGFAAGAALGFLAPLTAERLDRFWAHAADEVAAGHRRVIAADPGSLGTVQIVLGLADNGQHRCELAKLAVRADARGRGVGRLLVAAAEDAARSAGRTLVHLQTHASTPTVEFYAHLGYREVGRLPRWAVAPDGLRVDNIVMIKEID